MKLPCARVGQFIVRLSSSSIFQKMPAEDLQQEAWATVLERREKWQDLPELEQYLYLKPFIKKAMLTYSFNNERIVKMITTNSLKKAVSNIRKFLKSDNILTHELELEISKALNIPVKDVVTAYHFMFQDDYSITACGRMEVKGEDVTEELPVQSNLSNTSESIIKLKALYHSAKKLTKNHFAVLWERWLNSDKRKTLGKVAEKLKLSPSGVAFIEKEAIEIIRKTIEDSINAIINYLEIDDAKLA